MCEPPGYDRRVTVDDQRGQASPIVQYWHSEDVPDEIAELLASFPERNPSLRHLVFHEHTAEAFIAAHLSSREVAAFRDCAVPAMQADYFRYCAILALGGLYSDADFRCVTDLRPLIPAAGDGQLFRGREGNVINGVFAFGSPAHAFLELALEIATANIERRLYDRVYYTTGAPIFMSLIALHENGSFDGLISRTAGSPYAKLARSCCEVIDDYDRVGRALKGIEVAGVGEYQAFVRLPEGSLRYKKSSAHWPNRRGEIFRTSLD